MTREKREIRANKARGVLLAQMARKVRRVPQVKAYRPEARLGRFWRRNPARTTIPNGQTRQEAAEGAAQIYRPAVRPGRF